MHSIKWISIPPFDEYHESGYDLWLIPTGNNSALSRLCPKSAAPDMCCTLTHRSVSGFVTLMSRFCFKVGSFKSHKGEEAY